MNLDAFEADARMTLNVRRWEAEGSGPRGTALLVHGWHSDSRTWWRVAPALAGAGWRVLAVDLPGHGSSPAPAGAATVRDWAREIARTLDAAGEGRLDAAVGHSAGGATLAELAASDPDRFGRILLEEPALNRRPDVEEHLGWLADRKVRALIDPEALGDEVLAANPDWQRGDAEAWVAALVDFDLEAMAPSLRAGLGYRTADLLPGMSVPVLVVAGSQARGSILTGRLRSAVIAALPGDRFVELDAGHSVHRDRFEEYRDALLAWLGGQLPG